MTAKQAQLEQLLDSEITSLGYEFVGLVLMQQTRGSLLRIYIDKPEGLNMDDCTKVTRHVNSLLDVEDPIAGRYVLEVSSPGLDRPLFKPAHYQKVVGKKLKIKLQAPKEGRRNLVGILQAADAEAIDVLVGEQSLHLLYQEIDKANIEVEF